MNSEIKRIKDLIVTDILNTESECIFDAIAELASKVCDVPIALISFLDEDRQFFISHIGLDLKEAPIEKSFCNIATKKPDEIFIVEDARLDDRFKNNPLVNAHPHIVSYYGVPLKSITRTSYGTLCVIDQEVKILTDMQKAFLLRLAKQVEHLIQLKLNSKLLIEYQNKIERYSKDMEEFAYLAAHDLKSPVRAINSFVRLLDKKYENIWDEKDKQYISFINRSSMKMNSLIDDLLDYSKNNSDLNNFEEFDLKKLIHEIFQSFTNVSKEQRPILICENIATILSSKIAFTILFTNLISNALKYKKENQNCIIEINSLFNETHWIFTVKDNGIGIEPEYFNQIFKPFKRLHTDAEYKGNGLGLAACAKVADKMNGKITVSSALGEGSIFTVKIPKE